MKRVPAVLLVILVVAGLLRVGHWLQVRRQPFFGQLVMDSWEFDRWAVRIVQGDGLGRELFFQPPLYPYLLALIYLIAGHSYSAVYLLQILFGLAGIYALYRAGRLLFGESFGLAAAGLAALYSVFIFYDVQILKESLAVGLASFLLWALAAARDKGRAAAWLGAGLLSGLIALLRENMLIALPVLALLVLRKGDAWGRRLRNAAALVGGCLLVLLPVAVRNGIIGGAFLPTTFQGGVNFYIGNNPTANGWYQPIVPGKQTPEYERREPIRVARQETGRPLTPVQSSRYWLGKGLRWARENPGAFIGLLAKKIGMFWEWYERPDTVDYYYVRSRSFVLGLPLVEFGAVSLLALAGLWLRRRAWRTTSPAWLFSLAWMASTVVFFLFSRYRVPVVPALLLFAAVPLVEFGRGLKTGFTSKRALAGTALLLVLAAPHLAGFQYRKDLTHYNLGVVYLRLGRLDEAERNYRAALAANPKDFLSCVNLGILASGRKDFRAALDWYLKAAEIQPDSDGVQVDLGSIYGILGDLVKAREHLDRALALNPENVEALHNKAVVAARQGAFDEALSLNRRSLELAPDWKPALVLKDKLEKRAAVKTPEPPGQS
jgi:tetratricopeptide (TPR) repeat protein